MNPCKRFMRGGGRVAILLLAKWGSERMPTDLGNSAAKTKIGGNDKQFGQHPDCPGPVIIDGSMLPSGSYALRFKHPGPFSEVRGLKIQNVPGEAITDDGGNLVGGGPLIIRGCTITHNQVGIF